MKSIYAEITKFIPDLERLESAGEWVTLRPDTPGVQHMPHVSYEPLIYAFSHAMTPFIDYDYNDTLRTRSAGNSELAGKSEQWLLAYITCAIRADRFCEGSLKKFVESGELLKCLRRLEELARK
ncbi:hypothetical protein FJU30_06205 [Affinibrenneria salicis]|uniref:Uncharacterized protein n=1 Tax=Affinibrenneria salicis TaxID=2590031 RepID=A0A5J5G4B1_9GAMM|nr:DUF6508 domain-containing protein [Affinibrenneria salicis]KAA9001879.1 hypothetical protein FJU30_06205 [Affinibrenneria salicis]